MTFQQDDVNCANSSLYWWEVFGGQILEDIFGGRFWGEIFGGKFSGNLCLCICLFVLLGFRRPTTAKTLAGSSGDD